MPTPPEEFVWRFLDDSPSPVARDLGISADPAGDYRMHVREQTALAVESNTVSALAMGDTANLINTIVAGSAWYIRGFLATGDTDGYFELKINGSLVAFDKIGPVKRISSVLFPGFIYADIGDTVLMTLKNTGVITSDYQTTLYKGV